MSDYAGHVDPGYLEASLVLAAASKQSSYDELRIGMGAQVLDVGCGPGLDTVHLASIVGPTGAVTGVDADPAMVTEANERAAADGLSDVVGHVVATADDLPFDDASFDAVRSERMLQHVADPVAVVREMVRVTRPGGRVVLLDTDWASLSIDTSLYDLERRMVRFKCDQLARNGSAGRQLYRLLMDERLDEVTIAPAAMCSNFSMFRWVAKWDELMVAAIEAGVFTQDEATQLEDDLVARDRAGVSFGTINFNLGAGTRPLVAATHQR